MDKTRTISQTCVVTKFILSFFALERFAKLLSIPIILSQVVSTDAKQTETFVKIVFSDSGGLKT